MSKVRRSLNNSILFCYNSSEMKNKNKTCLAHQNLEHLSQDDVAKRLKVKMKR